MVECPKCKSYMRYAGTDAKAEVMEEGEIQVEATAHYECDSCDSEVYIKYSKKVKLE